MDKFWEEKNVFITGVSGFVGSWLAKRLVDSGANVIGLIRDIVPKSNFYLLGLDKKITVVHGTVEDYFLVERILNEYKVNICFHIAAQAIVTVANSSPISSFKTNIEGAWNILDACRNLKTVQSIVVASSDKAYGVHEILPYHEDFPLNPFYPYDVSKACADLLTKAYYKTYDLPTITTRFANIYGGGDVNFSRIIPDIIRSVIQGKNPVLRSDGTTERDFIYIDDVVDLYLLLGQKVAEGEIKGEVFNAGANLPISMIDLVKMIIKISGREELQPVIMGKAKPKGEIDHQFMDAEKAKRLLGWIPKVSLEEGLAKALQWYKEYFSIITECKY